MLSLLAEASQAIRFEDLGLSADLFSVEIGSFTFALRWYSLAYIAGIVAAFWHMTRMVRAPGAPLGQRHVEDLFFYCTIGVILGGRLGYALFYQPDLFYTFQSESALSYKLLRLWDGGMSFHGGVLGVLAAILWVSRRGQLSFLRVSDYIAVNVPFAMMLGRLANFVNGELWGRPTDVSWAIVFPGGGEFPRHPSQLYEAGLEGLLLMIVLLLLFWKTRARFRPGLLVGLFTWGIATARFTVEFFREPDAQLSEFAVQTGLSMGQWLSMPMAVVGLALVIHALIKPPLASGGPQAAQR